MKFSIDNESDAFVLYAALRYAIDGSESPWATLSVEQQERAQEMMDDLDYELRKPFKTRGEIS